MKSRSIIYLHNHSGNLLKRPDMKRKSLIESRDLNSMSEREQIAAVKKDVWKIQYIQNPSLQVQLAAVKRDGFIIRFIMNPSVDVQIAAVKENGWVIEYIQNPDIEAQIAAVKQNGLVIQYIRNPGRQVQLAAVKQNGLAIQFIKNPRPELFTNKEVKTSIIRALLLGMTSGHSIDIILDYLDRHRVNWSELDRIRTVAVKKPITESKKSREELEEEIMSYMKSKDYELAIVNRSNMIFHKLFYHSGKVGIDSEITAIYRGNQNFDFTVTAKILIDGNVYRKPSDIVFNSPELAIAYLEKTLSKNIVNQYSSDIYPVITRELESPESMITALLDLTELSKLDNQSVRLFYEDNKPLILNTMKKGLLYSSRFNIEYVIKFLKSTGITWPELSTEYFHKQINTPEVRKEAVSKILIALQGDRMKQAERIVMKLRRLNLDWPELDIIERILYRKPIT